MHPTYAYIRCTDCGAIFRDGALWWVHLEKHRTHSGFEAFRGLVA